MENSELFETVLSNCFFEIKQQRDQAYEIPWRQRMKNNEAELQNDMLNLGGEDDSTYRFVMDQTKKIIGAGIFEIVVRLAGRHGLSARYSASAGKGIIAFPKCDGEKFDPRCLRNAPHILVISDSDQQKVFVFKEYGLCFRLHPLEERKLCKQFGAEKVQYVSMVDGISKAQTEILDSESSLEGPYDDDTLSLDAFFSFFFPKEEYKAFWDSFMLFAERAKSYLSYSITKGLNRDNLYRFKKELRLSTIPQMMVEAELDSPIRSEQIKMLKSNFIARTRRGSSLEQETFFSSLISAEWLFESLYDCQCIDLTTVFLGYTKALEQLLFYCLSQNTLEKTGIERKVWIKKVNPNDIRSKMLFGKVDSGLMTDEKILLDDRGYAILNDMLVSEQFKWCLTLGNMSGFIGRRTADTHEIEQCNRDVLLPTIDEETFGLLVDVLSEAKALRNDYLHKENLSHWIPVKLAREKVLQAIFLLVGSCKINPGESFLSDDYIIREFINDIATSAHVVKLPVFFVVESGVEIGPLFASPDRNILDYDENGDPIYSGIYFRTIGGSNQKNYVFHDFPDEIAVSYLALKKNVLPAIADYSNLDREIQLELADYTHRVLIYKDGKCCKEALWALQEKNCNVHFD